MDKYDLRGAQFSGGYAEVVEGNQYGGTVNQTVIASSGNIGFVNTGSGSIDMGDRPSTPLLTVERIQQIRGSIAHLLTAVRQSFGASHKRAEDAFISYTNGLTGIETLALTQIDEHELVLMARSLEPFLDGLEVMGIDLRSPCMSIPEQKLERMRQCNREFQEFGVAAAALLKAWEQSESSS